MKREAIIYQFFKRYWYVSFFILFVFAPPTIIALAIRRLTYLGAILINLLVFFLPEKILESFPPEKILYLIVGIFELALLTLLSIFIIYIFKCLHNIWKINLIVLFISVLLLLLIIVLNLLIIKVLTNLNFFSVEIPYSGRTFDIDSTFVVFRTDFYLGFVRLFIYEIKSKSDYILNIVYILPEIIFCIYYIAKFLHTKKKYYLLWIMLFWFRGNYLVLDDPDSVLTGLVISGLWN